MSYSGTGYNWTNTSQWSKVPTTPADQNGQGQNSAPIQTQQNFSQQQYTSQSPQSNNQEPRKDMVTRLYRSILGREPDIAGLNYYLYNTHLSEGQISKEMYESTEHADLVAKAKDIRDMIKKTEESQKKMKDMEYTLQSLQVLNENYKSLLEQKTNIINQMRGNLQNGDEYQITEPNFQQPTPQNQEQLQFEQAGQINQPQNYTEVVQETDGTYLLQDPFEDDYENRKGCMGWIKSWFKFV